MTLWMMLCGRDRLRVSRQNGSPLLILNLLQELGFLLLDPSGSLNDLLPSPNIFSQLLTLVNTVNSEEMMSYSNQQPRPTESAIRVFRH